MAKVNEEIEYAAPPVQTQLLDRFKKEIQPDGDDQNASVITFNIPNSTPNTVINGGQLELFVEMTMEAAGGGRQGDGVKDNGMVNNILHSLWTDIDVKLEHRLLEPSNHLYHYKAMLHQMVNWTPQDRNIQGELIGFEVDDNPDDMDSTSSARATEPEVAVEEGAATFTAGTNEPPLRVRQRKLLVGKNGTSYEFMGALHVLPFNTPFLIPPGLNVQLSLTRSNPDFVVMSANNAPYYPRIQKVRLRVPYVVMHPTAYAQLQDRIDKEGLQIPVQRYQITEHTVDNQLYQTKTLLRNKQMPSKVFVAFVDTGALKGDRAMNPYNFQNFDLEQYEFQIGARRYPTIPMRLDFKRRGTLTSAYTDLLAAMGIRKPDGLGSLMDFDKFMKGHTIIGADFTANVDQSEEVTHLTDYGDLSLMLQFKTAPTNCTMLLLAYYNDHKIVVTKNREVTTSWV